MFDGNGYTPRRRFAACQAATHILEADTVEKVWELVSSLLEDGNGYSDTTYLANARKYVALARKVYS